MGGGGHYKSTNILSWFSRFDLNATSIVALEITPCSCNLVRILCYSDLKGFSRYNSCFGVLYFLSFLFSFFWFYHLGRCPVDLSFSCMHIHFLQGPLSSFGVFRRFPHFFKLFYSYLSRLCFLRLWQLGPFFSDLIWHLTHLKLKENKGRENRNFTLKASIEINKINQYPY